MIRKFLGTTFVLAFIAATAQSANAQAAAASSSGGFGVGYSDIGVVVGLGGIGSASASFGGRFEHGFKALPDLGNGTLGIEVAADYWSYSNNNYSVKYIPIGVTVNYHFKLDSPQFDPFVGIGLGYDIINCSYAGISNAGCSNSDIYFIGRAGIRYFVQPSWALYADVGAGAATLNLGVMFKLQ